eukprot:1146141-Pelagomonas_calceolata.AAC.2
MDLRRQACEVVLSMISVGFRTTESRSMLTASKLNIAWCHKQNAITVTPIYCNVRNMPFVTAMQS